MEMPTMVMEQQKSSIPVLDWSEFNVWCYLIADVKKHNKEKPCQHHQHQVSSQHQVADHIPCSTYIASRGIISQRLYDCVEIFKHRDTKLVTGPQSAAETVYAQFLAGAVGGITATYSTHWLDTIKVRMQTFPGHYPNGLTCLRTLLKETGISGLYQGAGPAVVGHAFKAAFVFMSYGLSSDLIRALSGNSSDASLKVWQHASAGALTGVAASLFICPLELVKCRMQALHQMCNSSAFTSNSQLLKSTPALIMMKEIVLAEGIRGLYRGLPGMWVKEIPGSFIYFGSYHLARSFLQYCQEKDHLSSAKVFSCGVFAGLCYCATHPLESVKTRVQVMSAVTDSQGFLRAFGNIVKQEGLLPLCSGLKTQMLRSGIFSGIQFLVYETTKTCIVMRQDDSRYDNT